MTGVVEHSPYTADCVTFPSAFEFDISACATEQSTYVKILVSGGSQGQAIRITSACTLP